MAKRYLVARERHNLETIAIMADSKEEAIEESRKKLAKEWSTLDNSRKTGYAAKRAVLSGSRDGDGTAEPVINGHSSGSAGL